MDGFETTDTVTAYPAVWGNESDDRVSPTTHSNKYLSPLSQPRPKRQLKDADILWTKSAQLLIVERMRLTHARALALRSQEKVLSNVFWELQVGGERYEKALTAWFNSSLGLLTLLPQRTTTEGGWAALKKGALELTPVLDVQALSRRTLSQLADLYDQLAYVTFLPLPEMEADPARAALDDGLSEILDLPDLAPLRRLLASEPVISNERL